MTKLFAEVMGEYVANASGNYLANKQEMVVTDFSATFRDSMDVDIKNEMFTEQTATAHIKELHENLNCPYEELRKRAFNGRTNSGMLFIIEAGDLEEVKPYLKRDMRDVTGKKGA